LQKLPHWTTALLLTILCDETARREIIEENLASRLVSDFGLFDPTLDLSNYKYPIDLLKTTLLVGLQSTRKVKTKNKLLTPS
jgi:S-DNA-T family DNA segregation ATPase FtsK/SpoIIIE